MLQPCARAYATDMLAAARRKSRARCRSRSGCVSALHVAATTDVRVSVAATSLVGVQRRGAGGGAVTNVSSQVVHDTPPCPPCRGPTAARHRRRLLDCGLGHYYDYHLGFEETDSSMMTCEARQVRAARDDDVGHVAPADRSNAGA